jgi:hypothetical protein
MESLPPDAVNGVTLQLTLLNVLFAVYLVCKGLAFATAVFMRRDPPKKSIRSKLARSDES